MKQAIYETAQKMMQLNKRTLKDLHDIFGFDFENEKSSVRMVEVKTPFTFNKVIFFYLTQVFLPHFCQFVKARTCFHGARQQGDGCLLLEVIFLSELIHGTGA